MIEALVATAAVPAALGAAYLSPALTKPRAIARLRERCRTTKSLVLTYDDGPGPETTRRLIELLRRLDARATFFLSARRIPEHREVALELIEAGHELGSHGLEHVHAWKAPPWAVARDVRAGHRALVDLGVERPPFRPPHGKATLATRWGLAGTEAPCAWWTHDSGDSFDQLPEALPGEDDLVTNGGVLLLHDLDRSDARNEYVLAATERVVLRARSEGLHVRTFGQLRRLGRV